MLILSRVCAEFHDPGGRLLLTIRPKNLLSFIEAPDAIRSDPLFTLLQRDGSLEAVESVSRKRRLENDPQDGAAPDGSKKMAPADAAPDSSEQTPHADATPDGSKKAAPAERKPASRKKAAPTPAEKPAPAAEPSVSADT